jgi:uncharacterized OsmC-like protein
MATKEETVQGVVNGIDVKALNGTIEAVKGNPAIAQATFAVESALDRGLNVRSRTGSITLGGQAIAGRAKTFRFEGDHPPELLGHDQGPAAVETLLAALGECVSSGFTMYGAAFAIPVDRVRMDLTGYIDLQGMLGLPAPGIVRPGFERIHAKIYVKSRAPRAELEKLKEMAEGLSPVKDSLRAVAYTSELIVEN